ncbi:MAG: hypothetical protein ACKO0M_01105 [Cyanobium sp.]
MVLPLECGVNPAPRGRVVFALPILLPEELFIPLDLLLARTQRSGLGRRSRLQMPRTARGA